MYESLPYIFILFILIIVCIYIYIKMKYGFWFAQPVFHVYDFLLICFFMYNSYKSYVHACIYIYISFQVFFEIYPYGY